HPGRPGLPPLLPGSAASLRRMWAGPTHQPTRHGRPRGTVRLLLRTTGPGLPGMRQPAAVRTRLRSPARRRQEPDRSHRCGAAPAAGPQRTPTTPRLRDLSTLAPGEDHLAAGTGLRLLLRQRPRNATGVRPVRHTTAADRWHRAGARLRPVRGRSPLLRLHRLLPAVPAIH